MKDIQTTLNDYFNAWNQALQTKDGEFIRQYMSRSFVGYWAYSEVREPDPYYYDYDLHLVLKQMNDAEKSFHPLSIVERKGGQEAIVVGRETNVIKGEPFSAHCMFIWGREDEGWKLQREYIELES
ncbi:DUF4440 domain-containing protein [Pontibacillus salicampi]|uniref:DUF4440 domain-containing protein n=1 Tax=Pontibacillus salicampi TaxID=1449801 RepID=A0ABV6LKH7_9BACI